MEEYQGFITARMFIAVCSFFLIGLVISSYKNIRKEKLREKKLKDGKISYYLDYYDNYSKKRKYEFIGIQSTKGNRREKKALAETIRKARETEYQHTNFNLIPDFKKRTSLIKYFEIQFTRWKWMF